MCRPQRIQVMHYWAFVLVALFAPCLSVAQESGFVSRTLTDNAGEHRYQVYLPKQYTADRKWPVILFLHGAGERGTDGQKPVEVGLGPVIQQLPEFPYIAVFPQCEDTDGRILTAWNSGSVDGQRALKILDAVIDDYSVDPSRQILTGWSMGGYGSWSLAAASPDRWWAIVPLSGGVAPDEPVDFERMSKVPVWAFHGATDEIVRSQVSRDAVAAFRQAGGNASYTELKNVGHDIWRDVYADPKLWSWLKDPAATTPDDTELVVRPGQRPALAADTEAPFVPALDVANAVYLRMGNEMLDALAHSIPNRVPADVLRGRIGDLFDSTVAEGRTFRVQFSGISYSAQVGRAYVKAYGPNRLNIQLGIQNAQLSIRSTYVTGRSHSAVAGPIRIGIGHRGPVWLSIAVEPYVENRQIKLKLIATRFDIPQNNWYVTSPAGVSTRGFGMTRERVSRGLVSGLYGSRRRIENEVRGIVPGLLSELEKNLDLAELGNQTALFWPLPVYKPRLKVWPQEVATDARGVSLVFGITAAAVDPQQPPTARAVTAVGIQAADDIATTEQLEFGIDAQTLNPLSQLLIDADVARVHVDDIPNQSFAAFSDVATLRTLIPDLANQPDEIEVWSELVLLDPLDVSSTQALTPADTRPQPTGLERAVDDDAAARTEPDETSAEPEEQDRLSDRESAEERHSEAQPTDPIAVPHSNEMRFDVPRLAISVAIRRKGDASWTPYVECEFSVVQKAVIGVGRPDDATRMLRLEWSGQPEIEARPRFAPGYKPNLPELNPQAFARLFADAWQNWTGTGPARETVVADIDFGDSVMRLEDLGVRDNSLYARFQPPGIKITNASDTELVYEVRSMTSSWGGPYRLQPGKTDKYNVAYPLNFRRRVGNRYQEYQLPLGSHSEFREPRAGGPLQLFRASRKSTRTPSDSQPPQELDTSDSSNVDE